MTVDTNQLGMAIFLLIAVFFNLWFVISSYRRVLVFSTEVEGSSEDVEEAASINDDSDTKNAPDRRRSTSYQLLSYAVLTMATFDIPWVWLCMIQCWNNVFNTNGFNQNSGDDSFGCKFMGWYSSFSLVGMTGSHCLVAYYLMNYYYLTDDKATTTTSFFNSKRGWMILSATLLIAACLFASMPLMQGDDGGYALTSGGFCYADFTNVAQASTILAFTLFFLLLSTVLWIKIGQWKNYWYYYIVFFSTWILWIPAACYGIAKGMEISSPYMIIGAIIGHANAIINPILYGLDLFRKVGGR